MSSRNSYDYIRVRQIRGLENPAISSLNQPADAVTLRITRDLTAANHNNLFAGGLDEVSSNEAAVNTFIEPVALVSINAWTATSQSLAPSTAGVRVLRRCLVTVTVSCWDYVDVGTLGFHLLQIARYSDATGTVTGMWSRRVYDDRYYDGTAECVFVCDAGDYINATALQTQNTSTGMVTMRFDTLPQMETVPGTPLA